MKMRKIIAYSGLIIIGLIWIGGTRMWSHDIKPDIPVSITHGDPVIDFNMKELP